MARKQLKKQPKKAQVIGEKKTKKATAAEANRRTFAVYSFLVRGADRVKILQYGAEKWGLKDRQMDYYIAEAHEWLHQATQDSKAEELKKSRAQRMDLYFKALANGDISLCHEVRKDQDKLLGLYPTLTLKHKLAGEVKTSQALDLSKLDTETLQKLAQLHVPST